MRLPCPLVPQDTLPVFYEAAQQVLEGWTGTARAGRGLPPHTHVSSFMELLSLAPEPKPLGALTQAPTVISRPPPPPVQDTS